MAFNLKVREELSELMPTASFVKNKSIAVLLPCHNEAATIATVVQGFRQALPGARIYVYDNNSTDGTADIARAEGAIVRHETRQGKGHVVRRMLADIDADVYVMADGDATYDASAAGHMVDKLVSGNYDMIVGTRVASADDAFRRGHRFGNRLFNRIVSRLFGPDFTDILSGYRVLSRRFTKSFPASSPGFEIETEFSIHAIDLRLPTAEVPLHYAERPANSASKLKTYRDGTRILLKIVSIYRLLRPMGFYGAVSGILFAAGLSLGAPVIAEYLSTGLVPRFPTAILAASLIQVGVVSLACGIIIDAVSSARREMRQIRYLDLSAPGDPNG